MRPFFDCGDVLRAQFEVRSREEGIDLVGAAKAHDGPVDRRVAEGPRDGDGSRRRPATRGDLPQSLDKGEVS